VCVCVCVCVCIYIYTYRREQELRNLATHCIVAYSFRIVTQRIIRTGPFIIFDVKIEVNVVRKSFCVEANSMMSRDTECI
jgi:hypothetical protein